MTVEFVAVTPMLLLALVFSFEFGRALWAYDVITRDVRGGLRYLSRTSSLPSPPNCPASTQNIVRTGSPTDSTNTHFPWTGVSATFTCNIATFATGFNQSVSVITMQANVPVALSFMSFFNTFSGSSVGSNYTLTVSDQARWMGN